MKVLLDISRIDNHSKSIWFFLIIDKIVNDSQADLQMLWVLVPGGLENFFQAIGRPRTPGEPAPAPFPRPENVEQIERDTVFAALGERPSGAE